MDNRYPSIKLKEEFTIDRLYSFHYKEFSKNYVFPGEQHDFWEFLYVDKGEVEIRIDDRNYVLKQGELIFYAPNELHSLMCNRRTPPNTFIISFDCSSENLQAFSKKTLKLGNVERLLLSQIIEEGQHLQNKEKGSSNPRNNLGFISNPPFGSEQLIKLYMETLFIKLYRNRSVTIPEPKLTTIVKEKEETDLSTRIKQYIEAHLTELLTLQNICRDFSLSKTHLTSIFKAHNNCSIIEYWRRLKIEKAKQYIREETYNVSEIAVLLGFSSIHYFSRRFKQSTGISPSEYQRRLRAKM